MLDRRRFNAVLAFTAGWVALGPIGTTAAQRQSRGAVYASVDARLYRIRQDGNTLTREARPLILGRSATKSNNKRGSTSDSMLTQFASCPRIGQCY